MLDVNASKGSGYIRRRAGSLEHHGRINLHLNWSCGLRRQSGSCAGRRSDSRFSLDRSDGG